MHYYMQNMLQVKLEGHMQEVVQLVEHLQPETRMN